MSPPSLEWGDRAVTKARHPRLAIEDCQDGSTSARTVGDLDRELPEALQRRRAQRRRECHGVVRSAREGLAHLSDVAAAVRGELAEDLGRQRVELLDVRRAGQGLKVAV